MGGYGADAVPNNSRYTSRDVQFGFFPVEIMNCGGIFNVQIKMLESELKSNFKVCFKINVNIEPGRF